MLFHLIARGTISLGEALFVQKLAIPRSKSFDRGNFVIKIDDSSVEVAKSIDYTIGRKLFTHPFGQRTEGVGDLRFQREQRTGYSNLKVRIILVIK